MSPTVHAIPIPTTDTPSAAPTADAYGRLLGGIVLQILRDYLAAHPERALPPPPSHLTT